MRALFIPMRVDALVLDKPTLVDGPDVDTSRLMSPDGISPAYPAGIGSPAVTPWQTELAPGVHLHWALPDGLMRGVSHRRPWAPFQTGGMWFPALPNRWLILKDGDARPLLVESDYIYPPNADEGTAMVHPVTGDPLRIGRCRTIDAEASSADDWMVLTALGATPRGSGVLGQADPAFSALYANCRTVFGHHDAEGAVGKRYRVVGYYSDPEDDPLAALVQHLKTGPEVLGEPLARNDPAAPLTDTERAEAETAWLSRVFGWTDESAKGLPDRLLCVGEVRLTRPSEIATTDGPLTVAIGHTGAEALSAWLADDLAEKTGVASGPIETRLEALSLKDRLAGFGADLPHRFDELRHDRRFETAPTAARFALRPQGDAPGAIGDLPVTIATALDDLKNAADDRDRAVLALARQREHLALVWSNWMSLRTTPAELLAAQANRIDPDSVANLIGECCSAVDAARVAANKAEVKVAALRTALAAELRPEDGWQIVEVPGPGFQRPRDPVVMLSHPAVAPSLRHLKDGKDKDHGFLTCQSVDWPDDREVEDIGSPGGLSAVRSLLGVNWPQTQDDTAQDWHPFRAEWSATYTPYLCTEEPILWDTKARLVHRGLATRTLCDDYVFAIDPSGGHGKLGRQANIHDFGPGRDGWPHLSGQQIELTGRAHLSDHAAPVLGAALKAFRTESLGANQTAEPMATLIEAAALAERAKPQGFGLAGLAQAIAGRTAIPKVPVADPHSPPEVQQLSARVAGALHGWIDQAPLPDQPFLPLIGGRLEIGQIRVVDNFGRVKVLRPDRIATADGLTHHGGGPAFRLAPRLSQPARLRADWIAAGDPAIETADHPATGPVLGWLAVNHLDPGRVAVHAANGSPLGLMATDGRWRPAPGDADAPLRASDIPDPDLARRIAWLVSRPDGEGFASAFSAAVDRTVDAARPPELDDDSARALIMGRPLAILRCRLSLELFGAPAKGCAWGDLERELRGEPANDMAVQNLRLPIAPGTFGRAGDGLVGYWIDRSPASGDAGLDPSPFIDGFHTILPDGAPLAEGFTRQEHRFLPEVCASGGAITLTVLMDPRGALHLRTGLLPTVTLGLDNIHFRAAMARVGITHPVTPLITHPGQIEMPLPALGGGEWSWIERRGDDWSTITEAAHVTRRAIEQAWPGTTPPMWDTLIAAGWIVDEGNAAGARLMPPEDPARQSLGDGFDPLLTATALHRLATRIAPPLHTPRFDRPMELREGWLRFRPTEADDTNMTEGDT